MQLFGRFIILYIILIAKCRLVYCKFDPYVDNGGTIVGVAGRDFCVLACDTRLSDAYLILSRSQSRVFELSTESLFAASGCVADSLALVALLHHNARSYQWQSGIKAPVEALSQLLSSTLYSRRTFPYFSFCSLAGIDKRGTGALYRYDAVGSFERVPAFCSGKGEQLIQPILDSLLKVKLNSALQHEGRISEGTTSDIILDDSDDNYVSDISSEEASNIVISAFRAAAEREITVGDGLELLIIKKDDQLSTSATRRFKLLRTLYSLPHH